MRKLARSLVVAVAGLSAAVPAKAQQLELVSKSAFPLDTAGGVQPVGRDSVSDDGRYVVFVSNADNVVAGQIDANGVNDVFFFDRLAGQAFLVSRAAAPATTANGASDTPTISGDGNWVVFRSAATNLTGGFTDANGATDVFLFERATGSITLASRTSSPITTGNGASAAPAISADGGRVAFQSSATDLGPGFPDANGANDVFLFDRAAGTIGLVTHTSVLTTAANGASVNSGISADGNWVVFLSGAANLGTGITDGNGQSDIFLYERATGSIVLVSHTSSPTTTGNGGSGSAAISSDGGIVAFNSGATDLGSGITDANGFVLDVFVFERATGAITLASHTSSTTVTGNNASFSPVVSRDGNWVGFTSSSSNLGSGITDGNAFSDVFLYERASGILSLVSHASAPSVTANRGSTDARLGQDGSWVAFSSNATDLGPGFTDPNGFAADVFLYERATNSISLVSHTSSPTTTGNTTSELPAISADGSYVAFRSNASNLGPGFADKSGSDIFLYERGTTGIVVVSRADGPASATAGGASNPATLTRYSMSDDGRFLAFASTAPNLFPGQVDTSGASDAFLYDRVSGGITLVSHAAGSPNTAAGSTSNEPVVSADGNWVAFQSFATNLVAGQSDGNNESDIFLFERATGAITLASRTASPSTTGNGRSSKPRVSADGGYVAFESSSSNLGAGLTDGNGVVDVFLFDRAAGSVILVSHTASATTTGGGTSDSPSLSGDGRYVAFPSDAGNLGSGLNDLNLFRDVFLFDRVTGAISVVSHTSSPTTTVNGGSQEPEISDDGNWVAFTSFATNVGSGLSNPSATGNVYLYERATAAISLGSHTSTATVGGDGNSFDGNLSADGRYLAFVSDSSDLGSGLTDANAAMDVFVYDRVTTGLTLVSHTASLTTTANDGSDATRISKDGNRVAFGSFATDLGPGFTDTNGSIDIFLWDRGIGTISLASHAAGSPSTAGNQGSDRGVIGFDGDHVAFESSATDMVPGDRNAADDLFLYSRAACAPALLVATPNGNNRIDLAWSNPGTYTHGVKRSRTSGGPYAVIGSATGTSFIDPKAEGGVTYFYIVSNGCGTSNEAAAETTGACQLPPDFPAAPTAIQAAGSTCAVRVDWSPAIAPCGGGVIYAVYRDTSPSFVPDVTNRLVSGLSGTTSYVDSAGVLVSTTYYYVVRATSLVNGEEDTNEVRVSATPTSCTSSAAAPVPFFDVRSGDGDNTLDWVNPGGTFSQTRITFSDDGATPACPGANEVPGSPFADAPGTRGNVVHTGLGNGTAYHYAACAEGPAVSPSSVVRSFGRPDTMAGNAQWGYATGAAALATPAVAPSGGYFVVSNDRVLHALARGTAGGSWPMGAPEWFPYKTGAPAQGRPTVARLPVTTVMGARTVALLGSQDGRVYAINGETGAMLWQSDVLGAAVQASPAATFRDFGAPHDLVLVGSREPAGDSRFYALRLADGAVAWSFDNGGGPNGIGIISSQAAVDAASGRVYFTSRRRGGGSSHTVWCLSFTATSVNKLWSRDYGDTDASPIQRGSALYVGNNIGEVRALNPTTGVELWGAPHATADGAVKGYIAPDTANGLLYFSTTGHVHAIRTDGNAFWAPPVAIGSPSPPVPRGGRLYVGGDNSRVYSIDALAASPPPPTSVELGDPIVPKIVGSPTFDVRTNLLIVGTDLGVVYAVTFPF